MPSRMTIGHLYEMICGKVAMIQGEPSVDGTPFNEEMYTPEDFFQMLRDVGFEGGARERMVNGMTGEVC